jgi:hypothetical protein
MMKLAGWVGAGVARDGGGKQFAKNVGKGLAKGAGQVGVGLAAGAALKAYPGAIGDLAMSKAGGRAINAVTPSNQTQADVAPVGAAIASTAATMGIMGGIGALGGATTSVETTTVVHFTSDAGVDGITGSGGLLRAGTYVTTPGEIPAGASSAEVEGLLEIGPGKGGHSVTFETPTSNLTVPENGTTTSGGAQQFQLKQPTKIDPKFTKTDN